MQSNDFLLDILAGDELIPDEVSDNLIFAAVLILLSEFDDA